MAGWNITGMRRITSRFYTQPRRAGQRDWDVVRGAGEKLGTYTHPRRWSTRRARLHVFCSFRGPGPNVWFAGKLLISRREA